MDGILCSFDCDGNLTALPDYSIEIYFDSGEELAQFKKFLNSGFLAGAYKKWKTIGALPGEPCAGTRLIDADKIPYSRETIVDESGCPAEFLVAYKDDVDRQPTVDAEPVRHGHWEHIIEQKPTWDKYLGERIVETKKTRCSACKETNKNDEPPYCPNCGARMDEEVESDE